MAIIDDYTAIAAAAARVRGERPATDDGVETAPPTIGRDSLVLEDGRLRLFPRRPRSTTIYGPAKLAGG